MTYTFKLPAKIKLGRKEYAINKNKEKNWHWQAYRAIKKKYTSLIVEIVSGHQKISKYPIRCTYTYFHGTKHKADLDNCITVIRKFAQDALKKAGFIEDDNWLYIAENVDKFGGYTSEESYCILEIESI